MRRMRSVERGILSIGMIGSINVLMACCGEFRDGRSARL